jgi:hypothetical protein
MVTNEDRIAELLVYMGIMRIADFLQTGINTAYFYSPFARWAKASILLSRHEVHFIHVSR